MIYGCLLYNINVVVQLVEIWESGVERWDVRRRVCERGGRIRVGAGER